MQYRMEEEPVLARFIFNSMKRDKAAFLDFSPKFDAAYFSEFEAEIVACETVVLKDFFVAELKKVTRSLYNKVYGVKDLMNKLEVYLEMAGDGLSIDVKDFGIGTVRDKADCRDVEGLVTALLIVIGNLTAENMAVLSPLGYTNAKRVALCSLQAEIKNLNEEQNLKMDAKEAAVQANKVVFKTLSVRMKQVMKCGKALFKFSDKEKLGDYTLAKLMRRVRKK